MAATRSTFDLDPPARRVLEGILRDDNRRKRPAGFGVRPGRIAMRARIVLLAAEGLANRRIAERLGISRPTVILWRRRFSQSGAAALVYEAPRSGRPRLVHAATIEAVLRAARGTAPFPATRWTVRAMAAAYGLSRATVHRIFRSHGVRPFDARMYASAPEERSW